MTKGKKQQLKSLHIVEYIQPLVKCYSTLVKLEVENPINELHMNNILKTLKNLKSLSIYSLWRQNCWKVKSFTENPSLEVVRLEHMPVFTYGYECFRDLIEAVPSLHSLIIPYTTLTKQNLIHMGKS